MKKISISLLLLGVITLETQAESLRCDGKLVKIGESKNDILEKCGAPLMIDHFCLPATTTTTQSTLVDDNIIQNNIVIQQCEEIDQWTFKPGKGRFITHLYFKRGQLSYMKYGERVK
jgi:hypothetical protein